VITFQEYHTDPHPLKKPKKRKNFKKPKNN